MMPWKILPFICSVILIVEADHLELNIADICAPAHLNYNKVQCFCSSDHRKNNPNADCYLTDPTVTPTDEIWDAFQQIKNVSKLTLNNMKGVVLKYIPTKALKHIDELLKIDIKYASIERIESFAFGNLTSIEEFVLRDNEISILEPYAFAHHTDALIISLDKNNIFEINRNVFFDLPHLDKLFLTSNNITIIHDRAFTHLPSLKELELNNNNLFSLNNETFFGLRKLQKLDLSVNDLEVIGDNTFQSLTNLIYLNLQGNKIQMLDDKAFNGLVKLKSLSLAHNKLTSIENTGVFRGLHALNSLMLKDNRLTELKKNVMEPILQNFYGNLGSFDIEDNDFPCDCRLEWFEAFMNTIVNENLKNSLHNLKCSPNSKIQELWSKLKQNNPEKIVNEPVFDDTDGQNNEFEYYDDTDLNGKLFYFDLKDFKLLTCTEDGKMILNENEAVVPKTTSMPVVDKPTTKNLSSHTELNTHVPVSVTTTKYRSKNVTNHGVLNLTEEESTTATIKEGNTKNSTHAYKKIHNINNDINKTKDSSKESVTTSRLATVSAKPIEHKKDYEENMPSDEGLPEITPDRSGRKESKRFANDAQRSLGCVLILISSTLALSVLT